MRRGCDAIHGDLEASRRTKGMRDERKKLKIPVFQQQGIHWIFFVNIYLN